MQHFTMKDACVFVIGHKCFIILVFHVILIQDGCLLPPGTVASFSLRLYPLPLQGVDDEKQPVPH
jgi:hypothetical protein